jgi:hypothetical protein
MKDPEILIEYAIKNLINNHARRYRGVVLWVLVRDIFPVGKTSAMNLCEQYKIDPWLILK